MLDKIRENLEKIAAAVMALVIFGIILFFFAWFMLILFVVAAGMLAFYLALKILEKVTGRKSRTSITIRKVRR